MDLNAARPQAIDTSTPRRPAAQHAHVAMDWQADEVDPVW